MKPDNDNTASERLTPHEGVVFSMVITSASDADISIEELEVIRDVLRSTPELSGFDAKSLPQVVGRCAMIISQRDGLEQTLAMIRRAVGERLAETAYRAAVAVAAADDDVNISESRVLRLLRDALGLDPMRAKAIEATAGPRRDDLDRDG